MKALRISYLRKNIPVCFHKKIRNQLVDPNYPICLFRQMETSAKFFVSQDGKEKISISKEDLQAGLGSGKFNAVTLAWTKGLPSWLALSDPYWEKLGVIIDSEIPPEIPPLNPQDTKSAEEELKVVAEKNWIGRVKGFYEGLPLRESWSIIMITVKKVQRLA